jgi:DNA-binding transcriptional LysR family regulator
MTTLSLLTMKQLRAFVAVYRLGKLSAAAERLSVTTSAVSVLIRQVETSLNAQLFDRRNRSLTPTPAAHEAIDSAERILQEVALLEAGFREQSERRRGRVHFAVTPAIGMALMPKTVRAFAHAYPHIRVIIEDCAPNQFLPRILNDQVEFGIGTPEDISGEIDVLTLVDDKLCLVCAADHPLARKRQVRWVDLASVPMIAVRPGYGVRRIIDRVAGKVGIDLTIAIEANFLTSALWMASSGLGVVILPSALLVQSHFKNLVARPLVMPTVSRAISIVTRHGRSLSPACQSFTEMLAHDLLRNLRRNRPGTTK